MALRRFIISAAVLVSASVALPAQASHVGSSCTNSQAVAIGGLTVPSCSMTVSCPGGSSHACSFRLGASSNGVGLVAARVFVPGQALPFTYCTGALSCASYASGYVVPVGTSKTVNCSGGDVAVNELLFCSATAT